MSTRKSASASSTVQGTKAENATAATLAASAGTATAAAASSTSTSSSTATTKTSVDSKVSTAAPSIVGKQETAAAGVSQGATGTNTTSNQLEKSEIHTETTKTFQQRVTRNSPLLLASASSIVTIKKEPLDATEPTNSESEDGGCHTGKKQNTTIRGRKSIKDHKEAKEQQDKEKEELETKDKENKDKEKEDKKENSVKDSNDSKDSKDPKDHKETKEQKESHAKDSADTPSASPLSSSVAPTSTSSSTTTTTNRLTRKSTANQENLTTSSTRVTRQRQTGGVTTRSETPPARGRYRGSNRVKMPLPMIEPATTTVVKRKRSVDAEMTANSTRKTSSDEPGPKYIKIEVKDPELDGDDLMHASQTTTGSTESIEDTATITNVKIKQEILEDSDLESQNITVPETVTTTATTDTTSSTAATAARGKGRWGFRKSNPATSVTTLTNNSPSTRATRQTRQSSPVHTSAAAATAVEPKRRRMGSQTRSLLKTNPGNSSKTQSISPEEEEDSKDSIASSSNTDDIVLAQIKAEKTNPDAEELISEDNKEDSSAATTEAPKESGVSKDPQGNDLPAPLTVDIETVSNENSEVVLDTSLPLTPVPAARASPSVSSGSEKAASLSPSELVSEGVSEISVKQFYKKPKFLENNLGIEEDPKLGNIVQKVVGRDVTIAAIAPTVASTASTATTTSTPVSSTSITAATVKNATNDDRSHDESHSNESLKEGTLRLDESVDERKSSITQDDANSLSSDDKLAPLVVDDDDVIEEENNDTKEEVELEETPVADAPEQIKTDELKVSESETIADEVVLDDISKTAEDTKPSAVIAVEEEQEEDELTIEESETISMDNNASVNDDATNEIEEEPENDEDVVNDLVDDTTPAVVAESEPLDNKVDSELSAPLQFTEDSQSSDDQLVIDDKENQELPNNDTDEESDKDKDVVLAKIDAELKKIDERHKEKLNAAKAAVLEHAQIAVALTPKDDEKIETAEQPLLANPLNIMAMDVDEVIDDIKVTAEDDKIITNDDVIADLELKLDDEVPSLSLEDIKIAESDRIDKIEAAEDVNEKTEIVLMKEEDKTEIETGTEASENILPDDGPIDSKESSNFDTSSNIKSTVSIKDDDTTSMKSGHSTNSWVTLDFENDDEESLRKKELHLQNLGLVTHKAAEKRRLEVIQSSAAAFEANKTAPHHQQTSNKRNGKNSSHAASTHHEYTGTLKTIIKLNRNSTGGSTGGNNGRKSNAAGTSSSSSGSKEQQQRRQSLKMTFQKGRGRAHGSGYSDRSQHDRVGHVEDNYYTIQNETEGALHKLHSKSTTYTTSNTRLALNQFNNNRNTTTNNSCNSSSNTNSTYARKSYNYRNANHHQYYNSSVTTSAHTLKMDSSNSESHDQQSAMSGVSTKKDDKEKILIPEKASSFKFHPGRLCEDQCYYCSGKFGLYDTPCHVGQIKSLERQQKILANEEKLTVDNCLCDACFRHVDRRANVPSYKKRLSAPGHLESAANGLKSSDNRHDDDQADGGDHFAAAASHHCLVTGCSYPAAHSLRRKCIRKSVKKFLLKFDVPTTAACIWLCQSHYDTVIQCSGCVLCKRRLGKNHMYHITSDTARLEKALSEMGIPVQLGIGTAVCKLCRYFANLLMKPPDSTKSQKAEFVKNYRKRLLQFHNIHDGSNDASEADEDDSNGPSSNNENSELQQQQQQTPQKSPMQEDDSSSNQKDPLSPLNSLHSIENELNEQLKDNASASETMDRDFENALTDSSSSSVSNTGSHSPNEMSKLKAILQSNSSSSDKTGAAGGSSSSDISNVLRANPNISMRELFPGEEDLGLHFKVPFGSNNSQRTPEGWTRVQTFLQYDEPTRRLWEELQKPYGNQSSFLRHLILLEKYFRNGDLVLSASASNNASVYTQTVRQRLTSYDKGHCGGLQAPTTSKETSKPKEPEPQIPTFEINEDDDDDDDDVEITEVHKSPSLQDNGGNHPRSRSLSVDKLTKQLSTNAVTITARPKDMSNNRRATPSPQKSLLKDNLTASSSSSASSANLAAANAAAAVALAASTASANAGTGPSNSRSILKCNLLGINKSVEIVPINNSSSTSQANKSASISNTTPQPPPPPPPMESKQQKILDVANKLLGNQLDATSGNKNTVSLLSSPPELVSLQRRSAGLAMAPIVPPPPPPAPASAPGPAPASTVNMPPSNTNNTNTNKRPQLTNPGTSRQPPPNVVILPDTLTSQERLQSKTWRPTLMPVKENLNLLKNGPYYQTVDGRILPALVQVQSGGKPYIISIFDYNRMCILRREKLMRDQMLKATKKRQEAKQQNQQQQHQSQLAQHQHQQQQQQQQHHQQQHQQQQHLQNKNMQNMNKNYSNTSAINQQRQQQQQQQQHQQQPAQQQLLQIQMLQHQHALLKAAAAAGNNSSNSQSSARFQNIAPKQPATSNISNMPPLQTSINSTVNFPAPMMPLLANAITNAANTGNVNPASNSLNNTSWLWNNFPDANQLLLNGAAANSSEGGSPSNMIPKLPQLLAKPNHHNNPGSLTATNHVMKQHQQQHQQQQQQQQQLLLSKIPKSLTVIPQHKLMNATITAASGNVGANSMKE